MVTKVAHIVWGLEIGGIETMLVNIVNHQCSECSVALIVINDMVNSTLLESIDPRVEVIRLSRKVGSYNPLPIAALNIALLRLKPTAIHCHSFSIANYLLPYLHRRALLTMHTTATSGMTREVCLKYKRIYAISKAVQTALHNAFGIESLIIHNGIDFSKVVCDTAVKPQSPLRIVQVGRLVEEKGHKRALRALAKVKSCEWIFDIIGSGEAENSLKELTEELGLSDKVRFLGSRSQEYIMGNLCHYHLLIQPSTVEGFGLSVVEAIAAKVDIAVSETEALTEIVSTINSGHTFGIDDSDSLVKIIEQVATQRASTEQLDRAYISARNSFDIARTAAEYLKEYTR